MFGLSTTNGLPLKGKYEWMGLMGHLMIVVGAIPLLTMNIRQVLKRREERLRVFKESLNSVPKSELPVVMLDVLVLPEEDRDTKLKILQEKFGSPLGSEKKE